MDAMDAMEEEESESESEFLDVEGDFDPLEEFEDHLVTVVEIKEESFIVTEQETKRPDVLRCPECNYFTPCRTNMHQHIRKRESQKGEFSSLIDLLAKGPSTRAILSTNRRTIRVRFGAKAISQMSLGSSFLKMCRYMVVIGSG
jgi:hypothetical protein